MDLLKSEGDDVVPEFEGLFPVLLIEPVLENLCTFLPVPELLRLRTICSKWDRHITTFLIINNLAEVNFVRVFERRDLNELTGSNEDEEHPERKLLKIQSMVRLFQEFTSSVISNSRRNVFTKYIFGELPTSEEHKNVVEELLQAVGLEMKSIEVEIPEHKNIIAFLREISGLAPNLESIHLVNPDSGLSFDEMSSTWIIVDDDDLDAEDSDSGDSDAEDSDTEESLVGLLIGKVKEFSFTQNDIRGVPTSRQLGIIFKAMPNLQSIKLRQGPRSAYSVEGGRPLRTTLEEQILGALMMSERMNSISVLWLSGLTHRALSLLSGMVCKDTKKGLALKELRVKSIRDDIKVEHFNEFLEMQKGTLTKLEIRYMKPSLSVALAARASRKKYPHPQRCAFLDPRGLKSLKSITMKITLDGILLRCLSPLVDLPHLVKVDISEIICDMAEKMSVEFTSPTVKDLGVYFQNGEWERNRRDSLQSPNSIVSLGKMFPCVELLRLSYPTRRNLEALPIAWPGLKYLRLTMKRQDYATPIKRLDDFEEIIEHFPYILELKGLESLSVTEHEGELPGIFRLRLIKKFPIKTSQDNLRNFLVSLKL